MTHVSPIETLMPPLSPLEVPQQSFKTPFTDQNAPGVRNGWRIVIMRFIAFTPALLTTCALLLVFSDWLSDGGLSPLEYLVIALVGMTFGWISLSVSTASLGLLYRLGWVAEPKVAIRNETLNIAVLVPAYNENPIDVFAYSDAMIQAVAATNTRHTFTFFVLSDTQDAEIADQELMAITVLRTRLPAGVKAYYRRRVPNTDRKTGNIIDWVQRWGNAYDAMLVLDADSLMSAQAVCALSDAMADDPQAGLIQSGPQIMGAKSIFARIQQFASVAYGGLLGDGLKIWAGRESNFWGHNAIIRTKAYAACAQLPKLRALGGGESLILSHDFVEAALLRRAGWATRLISDVDGSYEETPATLVDFALRDRRWCYGNMQHLRLLGSAGFHPISRFHMLHGAASYLLSPAWFVLLTIWAILGNGKDASVITYFNPANPIYPDWPEMSEINSFLILCFMYAMLMVPKIMGAATVLSSRTERAAYGGARRFGLSFLFEVVASIAYAPVMMVQQTVAVGRSALGIREQWTPQQRQGGTYSLPVLFKFHALETCVGTLLLIGMGLGIVSLWLLPIMISLILAVPLSALSGILIPTHSKMPWTLPTPTELNTPDIMLTAQDAKTIYAAAACNQVQGPIAAE